MSKQVELEKLDRAIKDGQIRLCTVQNNIYILDNDIAKMEELERTLEENLKCLKEKNVIALAAEYKKGKEDLAKARTRMITLKNERENYRKSKDNVETVMKKAQEDIDKIKKSGENNVLHGNFGRKENGQG